MPKRSKRNQKGKARGRKTEQNGEPMQSSSQTQLHFEQRKIATETSSPTELTPSDLSLLTPEPTVNTEPALRDSVVHERGKDSPETTELIPDLKQRKKELAPTPEPSPKETKETNRDECILATDTVSVPVKKSVVETGSGDIRKYAVVKGSKVEESRATKSKTKPARRTKKQHDVHASQKTEQLSIRDMFPVRRSTRKCKSLIETDMLEDLHKKLLNKVEDNLEVKVVDEKGRGVFTTIHRKKGDFICEYSGELISYEDAMSREEQYAKDTDTGCYMYYFEHKNTKYCVDATKDNGRMGRLLNHSKTQANVVTKLYEFDDQPYLCLIASRDIAPGEELQYDYGERSQGAIDAHPWLRA